MIGSKSVFQTDSAFGFRNSLEKFMYTMKPLMKKNGSTMFIPVNTRAGPLRYICDCWHNYKINRAQLSFYLIKCLSKICFWERSIQQHNLVSRYLLLARGKYNQNNIIFLLPSNIFLNLHFLCTWNYLWDSIPE